MKKIYNKFICKNYNNIDIFKKWNINNDNNNKKDFCTNKNKV